MSAITGIFYRDRRSVEPKLIKKMNNELSHRGPDGSAVWCDGSVALGHQMLWTTPESLHEKLPFEDKESGLVITADARIDNREELSKELGINNDENISDSYFILKSYARWGEECPEHLLGDFAFAIWDKNKERLFCARDHMGVKPFYYYLDDEKFIFGTEIKALFCIPGVEHNLNEVAIANHIYNYYEDKIITFYENIFRLPAAHNFTIDYEKYILKKYWSLDPTIKVEMDSDEEYAKTLRNIFKNAVRCRLRSAFPVGSQLSGGLDSSSIVCTARQILIDENKNPLKTFSAVFDDVPQSDERKYINEVIAQGSLEPYYVHPDRISPLKELEKMLWIEDEPFWIPNLFLSLALCCKAQKSDARIILTGEDGDTVLSHGGGLLKDLAHEMKWSDLIKEIKCISDSQGLKNSLLLSAAEIVPDPIRKVWWRLNGLKSSPATSYQIINPEFAKNIEKKMSYDDTDDTDNLDSKLSYARKSHYYSLNSASIQYVFEAFDRLAAAFKIEFRYPFYDVRMVEYGLSLPTEQKRHNGWTRIVMRRAMEGILPQKIQWRKFKGNLGYNFDRSIKFEEDNIENLIFKDSDLIKKYIDIDGFKNAYTNCRNVNYSNTYNVGSALRHKIHCNAYNLWKVITLGQWLKKIS